MRIEIEPIGYVKNKVEDRKDVAWGEDNSTIYLEKNYISGLKGLKKDLCGIKSRIIFHGGVR